MLGLRHAIVRPSPELVLLYLSVIVFVMVIALFIVLVQLFLEHGAWSPR